MINRLVYMYENFMLNTFGYDLAVRLEDIFYGAGMYILGAISMAFLGAYFILRLHGVEDFGQGKLKLLRYDNGNKSTQYVHLKNLWSSFQVFILLAFSPFCTINRFTQRDERRTKRFVGFVFVLAIIILLCAIVASWSVLRPPTQ